MRPDLSVLAELVPRGARVLDLGCGDGELLLYLIGERDCTGIGVEISDESFHACIERGVPVIQGDIDDGLGDFADGAFDVVVLSQTLPAIRNPALVVRELLRVGRFGAVSFPNAAFLRRRVGFAARGRTPIVDASTWWSTAAIHPCSIRDFEQLLATERIATVRRILLDERGEPAVGLAERRPNLLAAGAAYQLTR